MNMLLVIFFQKRTLDSCQYLSTNSQSPSNKNTAINISIYSNKPRVTLRNNYVLMKYFIVTTKLTSQSSLWVYITHLLLTQVIVISKTTQN